MGTQYPDLFAELAKPFDPSEVKVRSQAGRQLHYITARTAMNRLDDVLGPENWSDSYVPTENGTICVLAVTLPDGRVVTKCDAGGDAGMSDQGDNEKSGFSDSFKRACVKFGVGRYLYRDGVPGFVQERLHGQEGVAAVAPQEQAPRDPRRDPRPGDRQHPPQGREPGSDDDRHGGQGQNGGRGHGGPPRSGKALFAWTKDREQEHAVSLLKYLNGWAKLQEFPGRMIDFTPEQVELAYREAVRKLEAVRNGHESADDRRPTALGDDRYEGL